MGRGYSTQNGPGHNKKPLTFHKEEINPRRQVGRAEEQPNQLGVNAGLLQDVQRQEMTDTETQEDNNVELPACWAGCVEKRSVHVCTTRPV